MANTESQLQQARTDARDALRQIVMPWLKGLCDRVGPILQAKAGKVGEDIDFVHDVFQARCGNSAAPDIEEYVTRNPDRKLSQSEAKAIGVEIAAILV